jgi:hypothetical protein
LAFIWGEDWGGYRAIVQPIEPVPFREWRHRLHFLPFFHFSSSRVGCDEPTASALRVSAFYTCLMCVCVSKSGRGLRASPTNQKARIYLASHVTNFSRPIRRPGFILQVVIDGCDVTQKTWTYFATRVWRHTRRHGLTLQLCDVTPDSVDLPCNSTVAR